ncbi:DUF6036 family nucleotidyltransferase [Candidatus Solincola tengchongensis]|uniref:DUF6036 family nucleotidyltransferase n=1 Tax=Candidatus Solincola tengchongensis TaxID=2900693 RepID=UPI0025799C64|nr:DUF6036 family nucleotidyltransferase [Candidatus Solincola tengchongensis]
MEDPKEFAERTFVLPCLVENANIRIDFVFLQCSYEERALRRVKPVRLKDVDVKFASLEDSIIHKIIAGRPHDIEDVEVVLAKNPDFEREYVLHWPREFDRALQGDLTDSFQKLLKEREPYREDQFIFSLSGFLST